MATSVVRNHAEAVLHEEEQLPWSGPRFDRTGGIA